MSSVNIFMEADIFQFMLLVLASSAPHDDHDLKF